MGDLIENNLVRFKGIKKRKEGLFADFKVKGIKGGASYTTSITVDISGAEVYSSDPLEKIIEASAKLAVKELQKTDLQFEGLQAI